MAIAGVIDNILDPISTILRCREVHYLILRMHVNNPTSQVHCLVNNKCEGSNSGMLRQPHCKQHTERLFAATTADTSEAVLSYYCPMFKVENES